MMSVSATVEPVQLADSYTDHKNILGVGTAKATNDLRKSTSAKKGNKK